MVSRPVYLHDSPSSAVPSAIFGIVLKVPETHPALTYMYKALAARRVRLHEVASRRHRETIDELKKVREQEKEGVWTWWTVSFYFAHVSNTQSDADVS